MNSVAVAGQIQPVGGVLPALGPNPLANAIVLIIRHAEKPGQGHGLSPVGKRRALAYVQYFQQFTVGSAPLNLDYLVAAADSKESHRPRLTLEPLSQALGLPIHTPFKDEHFAKLADALRTQPTGKRILICWHHEEIPHLVDALRFAPEPLLPGGKWPDAQFGWVLQLPFDGAGGPLPQAAQRIDENLNLQNT